MKTNIGESVLEYLCDHILRIQYPLRMKNVYTAQSPRSKRHEWQTRTTAARKSRKAPGLRELSGRAFSFLCPPKSFARDPERNRLVRKSQVFVFDPPLADKFLPGPVFADLPSPVAEVLVEYQDRPDDEPGTN